MLQCINAHKNGPDAHPRFRPYTEDWIRGCTYPVNSVATLCDFGEGKRAKKGRVLKFRSAFGSQKVDNRAHILQRLEEDRIRQRRD